LIELLAYKHFVPFLAHPVDNYISYYYRSVGATILSKVTSVKVVGALRDLRNWSSWCHK